MKRLTQQIKTYTSQVQDGGTRQELSESLMKDKTAENQEIKSLRKDAPANVDAFDKYESSPDLSSQLNPSGCNEDNNPKTKRNGKDFRLKCGEANYYCQICSAKRLATAKALYNEKKKTLEFLKDYSKHIAIIIKIKELESEIKQIENEVPEVKE